MLHSPSKARGWEVSGKLVIAAIFALALAAAAFSLWFHYYTTHQSVVFWGTPSAQLISAAPEIEVLRLSPEDDSPTSDAASKESLPSDGETKSGVIDVAGDRWRIVERKEASHAPGILNLRSVLLQDATYRGAELVSGSPLEWRYALRFARGDRQCVVLFDFVNGRVGRGETGATSPLHPTAVQGFSEFFAEQFPAAAAHDAAGR